MATRSSSRRSAGGEAVLNPALIQLLDTGRLKQELEKLGLSTVGAKNVLAERLEIAMTQGHEAAAAASTPGPPKTTTPKTRTPKQTKASPKNKKNSGSAEAPPKKRKKVKHEVKEEVADEVVEDMIIEEECIITVGGPGEDNMPLIASKEEEPEYDSEDDKPLIVKKAKEEKEKVDKNEKLKEARREERRKREKQDRAAEKAKEHFRETGLLLDKDDFEYTPPDDNRTPRRKDKPEKESRSEKRDVVEKVRKEERPISTGEKKKEDVPRRPQEKPNVVTQWAALVAERKAAKAMEEKKQPPPSTPSTTTSAPSEAEKKKPDRRVSFTVPTPKPRPPPPPANQLPVPSPSKDLLGSILGTQTELLNMKALPPDEAELEKQRIEMERRKRAMERMSVEELRIERERRPEHKKQPENQRDKEKHKRSHVEIRGSPVVRPPPPPPPPKSSVPPPPPPRHLKERDGTKKPESRSSRETSTTYTTPPPPYSPLPIEDTSAPSTALPAPPQPPKVYASSSGAVPVSTATTTPAPVSMAASVTSSTATPIATTTVSTPVVNDDFLSHFSDAVVQVYEQREREKEVRAFMEDVLERVEIRVEKELRWEENAKRGREEEHEEKKVEAETTDAERNEDATMDEEEQTEDTENAPEDQLVRMLSNPRAFLDRATQLLKSFNSDEPEPIPSPSLQISQIHLEKGEYHEEPEERPLPEFHGEPVPSDDDADALFEAAAGIPKKDKKKLVVVEEEAPPSHEHVLLDYYNADLHVKGGVNKPWLIDPECSDGLALMWGGVKSNYAVTLPPPPTLNKLAFQIKITELMTTRHIPFTDSEAHDVRVGFSFRTAPNILGEFANSYCYTALGRKANNNIFTEFGETFTTGDIITAVLDFDHNSISYWKNGMDLGVAFSNVALPEGEAVFCHVCVKNCRVLVNLGDGIPDEEETWSSNDDWTFLSKIERKHLEMSRLPPDDKAACTVLMMCGLPGVGKTTWVRQYMRDHPEETWNVINSEQVLNTMKVNGVPRARVHQGRWDMVMGLVAKSLNKLIFLAARRRRNYIIDMSNVSRDSRKRRLTHFKDFQKKAIVIIPDEEEMTSRQHKQARQEGVNLVPPEAMLELKAVFAIPNGEAEGIEEVHFIEPPIERIGEAIEIVDRFNEEGRPWYQKRYRGRGRRFRPLRPNESFSTPLNVNTCSSNGSGPPSMVHSSERKSSIDSPSFRGQDSPFSATSWSGFRKPSG